MATLSDWMKCKISGLYLIKSKSKSNYFFSLQNSDPDYSKITEGCTVLAKYKDELWYRGIVEDIIKGTEFSVKFQHCNDVLLLNLHAVYPLGKDYNIYGNGIISKLF